MSNNLTHLLKPACPCPNNIYVIRIKMPPINSNIHDRNVLWKLTVSVRRCQFFVSLFNAGFWKILSWILKVIIQIMFLIVFVYLYKNGVNSIRFKLGSNKVCLWYLLLYVNVFQYSIPSTTLVMMTTPNIRTHFET